MPTISEILEALANLDSQTPITLPIDAGIYPSTAVAEALRVCAEPSLRILTGSGLCVEGRESDRRQVVGAFLNRLIELSMTASKEQG
jgi:hypothetical protein